MTDRHTTEQRRRNMAAIRGRDTGPEFWVRRAVYALGYRYRLYRKDLPGKPDLVFSRLRKVIFVNGCYWHMHNCIAGRSEPSTNADFWHKKRSDNVKRDKKNIRELKNMGWGVLVVWQCELKNERVLGRICQFLNREMNP